MCVGQIAGLAGQGGLLENLGDPLGTRKRREDDQKAKWAREDSIRESTFAHEKEMAGMKFGNRSKLNTTTSGSGTGTPTFTRGGGRSMSGGSQSSKY